jgi:hypothetical protein
LVQKRKPQQLLINNKKKEIIMARMGFIDARSRGGRSGRDNVFSDITGELFKWAGRNQAAGIASDVQDKNIQANKDAAAELEASGIRTIENQRAHLAEKADIDSEKAVKDEAKKQAAKHVSDAKRVFEQHIALAQNVKDPTERAKAIKSATNIYQQTFTRPEIASWYRVPSDQEASNTAINGVGVKKGSAVSSASKNSFNAQRLNKLRGDILANQVSLDDENYRMLENGTGAGVGKFSNMSIQGEPESETGRTGSKRQQMLMDSTADISTEVDAWKSRANEANLIDRDMGFRDRTITETELAYKLNPDDKRFMTKTYEQKQNDMNLETANRLNKTSIIGARVNETNAEAARINAGVAESNQKQNSENNTFIKSQAQHKSITTAIASQYGTDIDPEGLKTLIKAADTGDDHAIYLLDQHDITLNRLSSNPRINRLTDEEINIPQSVGGGSDEAERFGKGFNPNANITRAMEYVPNEPSEPRTDFGRNYEPPEAEAPEPRETGTPLSPNEMGFTGGGKLHGSPWGSRKKKISLDKISKGKDLMNKIPTDVLDKIKALLGAGKKDEAAALRNSAKAKLRTK